MSLDEMVAFSADHIWIRKLCTAVLFRYVPNSMFVANSMLCSACSTIKVNHSFESYSVVEE